MSGNIHSISPSAAFLDTLASGVMERYGCDPLLLSSTVIMLPNRRSCLGLQEAFLRVTGGAPLLLPSMRPIGDADEDELLVIAVTEIQEKLLAIPPAISPVRRRLLLAGLLRKQRPLNHEQACLLAAELARFLDDVQREELPLDNLAALVPEELAEHWQLTLDFFRVLAEEWPRILDREGRIDPVDRRNRLLRLQADSWRAQPPLFPVIAAGSTGSIPASAALIAAIAGLPQGSVVLPGLDRALDEDAWRLLPPFHPQYGLKTLLETLKTPRSDVQPWHGGENISARERLVSAVMRPAETLGREISWDPAGLSGLRRAEAENIREEADMIALMLRESLETPGKTASLVTQDRALARRVAASLARWGIAIDDSAGAELVNTPPAVFLRLVLEMTVSDFAPVPLLSALKHPLACGGMEAASFRRKVRQLEIAALRGMRGAGGLDSIAAAVADSAQKPALLVSRLQNSLNEFRGRKDTSLMNERHVYPGNDESCFRDMTLALLADIKERTGELTEILRGKEADLAALLRAHIGCAEALAASADKAGAALLWRGDAGRQAAEFLEECVAAARGVTIEYPANHYPGVFETLWEGAAYRPSYGLHPRLAILSPMEARLQRFGLVILGGLNDGAWPSEGFSPWMSRPMRADFGLLTEEKKTGLSAHDFCSLLCADEVMLTRARKTGGAQSSPCRWLLRLDAELAHAGLEGALKPEKPWAEWARLLRAPERVIPALPPAPVPSAAVRPRMFSATGIEQLMRDPYGFYARKILRLRKLPDIDMEPDPAKFGVMVHKILQNFAGSYREDGDIFQCLAEQGREVFAREAAAHPALRTLWWPRFLEIARWVADMEKKRRHGGAAVIAEAEGKMELAAGGDIFTLTAKADRIEVCDNSAVIVDYKTGALPAKRDIEQGFSPQLPLELLIAAAGGFAGVPAALEYEAEYWKLSGRSDACELWGLRDRYKLDIAVLAAECREGVVRLLAMSGRGDTPYLSCPDPERAPKYNDYAHLARVKEWGE